MGLCGLDTSGGPHVKWSDHLTGPSRRQARADAEGQRTHGESHLPIEAIEPRRLYRQIADQLRHLIDSGEYPVGSRLPSERELADRLDVSRPTVREALIALEVEGRLKIRVGSGIYVIEHQPAGVAASGFFYEGPLEVIRARAFIESAVAEEAARRVTADDMARLDAVLAEADREALSCEQWVGLDRRFHTAIAATLGNAVLSRFIGELFDQRINPYFEQLARHIENTSTWRAAHEEHLAIRTAIAAGDPGEAREAMRVHLQRSHRRFSRDFAAPPAADLAHAHSPIATAASGRRARLMQRRARGAVAAGR